METQTQYQPIQKNTDYSYFFPKKNKGFKRVVEKASLRANLSTSQVSRIIKCFLEEVNNEVAENGKLNLYGVGVLTLKKNKERVLNAPNNKGQIKPAFWSVGFKYDDELKSLLADKPLKIKKK